MAQHPSYKNPPALKEDTVYETWKNEVEVWRLMTDLDEKKQALAVALTLTGHAREKVIEIEASRLNSTDGMKILIEALDELYKKDTIDLSYEAYSKFEKFRKSEDMKMTEYIVEFERLYTKVKKYQMVLPDAVLAFKLLDNANLEDREKQLALTASSDLKFATMKSSLKRIFGKGHEASGTGSDMSSTPGITIKQEPVYMTQKYGSRFGDKKQFQS